MYIVQQLPVLHNIPHKDLLCYVKKRLMSADPYIVHQTKYKEFKNFENTHQGHSDKRLSKQSGNFLVFQVSFTLIGQSFGGFP